MITNNTDDDDGASSNPFQKINPLLHGGIMEELRVERERRLSGRKRKKSGSSGRGNENVAGNGEEEEEEEEDGADGEQLFTMPFVKKYIHYAKNRFTPRLTDEAMSYISGAFVCLFVFTCCS